MFIIPNFPELADAVHVWVLSIADQLRSYAIDFPPAGASNPFRRG